MRITQALLVGWLGLLAACEVATPGAGASAAPAATPSRPGKPAAPVRLALTTRAAAGGGVWLTLEATPTQAVDALELSVGPERSVVGAVAAGERRRLSWRAPDQATADAAILSAVTHVGSSRRRAVLRAAPAPADPRARGALATRVLPGGVAVAEAR